MRRKRRRALKIGIGAFWALWLVGAAAALGLSLAASLLAFFPGDVLLTRHLQGVEGPLWEGLMALANKLGEAPWLAFFWGGAVLAFVIARRPWEALWMALASPAILLVGLVKALVGRPRPSPELVRVQELAAGPSFPSGHVFSDVLFFSFLFFLARAVINSPYLRFLVQGLCVLALIVAGLARVYVGAHWPSDVLGSYLLGGLVVALFLKGYYLRRRGVRR